MYTLVVWTYLIAGSVHLEGSTNRPMGNYDGSSVVITNIDFNSETSCRNARSMIPPTWAKGPTSTGANLHSETITVCLPKG